jgi:hypothetical protein
MDKIVKRLRAALGFVKAKDMIVDSAHDTWEPGCLVRVVQDYRALVVYLDRAQGHPSLGNSRLSVTATAFRDEEVLSLPLPALLDLVRGRVKASMESFMPTTLAQEPPYQLNGCIAEALGITY